MSLRLARLPSNLTAAHPLVIVDMLESVHDLGHNSPFVRKLKGNPFFELKATSRGGERSGARVYGWFLSNGAAAIVNCEIKEPDAATSIAKLKVCLIVYSAYQHGTDVFAIPTPPS